MTEDAATKLFLDALADEGHIVRQLSEGKLLPDQMVRTYAYVLAAANTIRPFAAKHQADALPNLDKLTRGVAGILIEVAAAGRALPVSRSAWQEHPLRRHDRKTTAGRAGSWRRTAGLSRSIRTAARNSTPASAALPFWSPANCTPTTTGNAPACAADWALSQPCCANFNYNAFSVSLLAHAYRISGDAKYLDGAVKKFRVGVAPGQAPNGRWLDAHNARTVYHVIILRALGDLASVLPAERETERAELDQVTRPAIKTLLDEFDAMGITIEALPELLTLAGLYPVDGRLQKATQSMTADIIAKCTDGQRVKMGAQPHQLATVAQACSVFHARAPSSFREENP